MDFGAVSRLEKLDRQLARIRAEDASIFTETFDDLARQDVSAIRADMPLAGLAVSVKDSIDVVGYRSRAGCKAREDCDAAVDDAPAVAALRKAGAILLGHTNMTELAYSGLGLNPHYGTPANAIWPDAVPGGSTSGGALSVANGFVDIALGSDTGGSLRIPAAFNGLVGFKPSQSSVGIEGCVSLSTTLDSIGPVCRTVKGVTDAWNVIRKPFRATDSSAAVRRIVIPENFGFDGVDEIVGSAFVAACRILQDHGIFTVKSSLPLLDDYAKIPVWQFSAVEAYCTHRELIEKSGDRLDPRVMSRLALGADVRAIDYLQTCRQRSAFRALFSTELKETALLMPTVAIVPPKLKDMQSDEAYFAANRIALRNTTLANVADGCSISIPFPHRNQTIGLMLTAPRGDDEALLSLAAQIEAILQE